MTRKSNQKEWRDEEGTGGAQLAWTALVAVAVAVSALYRAYTPAKYSVQGPERTPGSALLEPTTTTLPLQTKTDPS